jgi:hypothetical protein
LRRASSDGGDAGFERDPGQQQQRNQLHRCRRSDRERRGKRPAPRQRQEREQHEDRRNDVVVRVARPFDQHERVQRGDDQCRVGALRIELAHDAPGGYRRAQHRRRREQLDQDDGRQDRPARHNRDRRHRHQGRQRPVGRWRPPVNERRGRVGQPDQLGRGIDVRVEPVHDRHARVADVRVHVGRKIGRHHQCDHERKRQGGARQAPRVASGRVAEGEPQQQTVRRERDDQQRTQAEREGRR